MNVRRSLIFVLAVVLLLSACTYFYLRSGGEFDSENTKKTVYIQYKDGQYALIRNGVPFVIKGACGSTFLKQLKDAGGNTIRTYDTTNLQALLDEAQKYNIAVIAGLYMPKSEDQNVYYNKPDWVKTNFNTTKGTVLKYKNHPALLMWCVGNELYFPLRSEFKNFYSAFNGIVDMIHREDPNHPVTTTMINIDRKNILTIKKRTNIDIISFNVFYGKLKEFKRDIDNFSWLWKDPYMIMEWGNDGPWAERTATSWSAPIELTGDFKAAELISLAKNNLAKLDSREIGSLVFYWGYKQETTDTWFSFFAANGAASPMVKAMHYIWSGKKSGSGIAAIADMVLNGRHTTDNILLSPDSTAFSKIVLSGKSAEPYKYEWKIVPEDWNKKDRFVNNEKLMNPLQNRFIKQEKASLIFKAPGKEGPYRLMVSVYDTLGNFNSANIPFYVIAQK